MKVKDLSTYLFYYMNSFLKTYVYPWFGFISHHDLINKYCPQLSTDSTGLEQYFDDSKYFYTCIYESGKPSQWIAILEKTNGTITDESRVKMLRLYDNKSRYMVENNRYGFYSVYDSNFAKYRANRLNVVCIFNKFDPFETTDKFASYTVGQFIDTGKNILTFYRTVIPAYYDGLSSTSTYTGRIYNWCVDGRLFEQYFVINGVKNGPYRLWSNGYLQIDENYSNGKRTGHCTIYYPNSYQISSEGDFIDNEKVGFHLNYLFDGSVQSKVYHKINIDDLD